MENLWDEKVEEENKYTIEEKKIIETYHDIPFTNITWKSTYFRYLTASGFVLVFGKPIRCILGNYSELECISNPTTGERFIPKLVSYQTEEVDYIDQNGFKYVLEVPNREVLVAALLCNNTFSLPLYNTGILQYISSFMPHETI